MIYTQSLINDLLETSPSEKPPRVWYNSGVHIMTQDYPLVTIAIPTYNRAANYLRQSLASALAQTYPNIEIIVADNCSSDNTATFVTKITDNRLKYIRHTHNIGSNSNFNFCLNHASGNYFLLLHDDDMIDCDFVETCMSAARNKPYIGVIRTGIRITDAEGTVLAERCNQAQGLPLDEFFRAWFAGKSPFFFVNTLFNTRHLKDIGGFRSKHLLLDDGIVIVQLASKFGRVDVEEIKASFRKHPGELTFSAKVTDWGEDFLDLLNLMCKVVPVDKVPLLKREGKRFFANLTYMRADAIESPHQRLKEYFRTYRLFNYRYLPPPHLRLSPRKILYRTIRRATRKAKQLLIKYGGQLRK